MYKVTRRRFIQGTTGLLAMHAVPVAATLRNPTPHQSAGPFYPEELPLDDDNDLTHVAGQEQTASGQITDLNGRILDQGRYRFRTIRPMPYPGRTPHIHVAVFPAGEKPFTTQLYAAGDPRNESDFLYRRVPEAYRHLVTTEFKPSEVSNVNFTATWDIVLDVTPV